MSLYSSCLIVFRMLSSRRSYYYTKQQQLIFYYYYILYKITFTTIQRLHDVGQRVSHPLELLYFPIPSYHKGMDLDSMNQLHYSSQIENYMDFSQWQVCVVRGRDVSNTFLMHHGILSLLLELFHLQFIKQQQ